jgi:chaperonin cofactor prefoldin
MSLIPVENHPGLFRDSVTNAIVNRSKSDYERYTKTRNNMLSKEERINHLEEKVDHLSNDIGDIKSMLQSFLSNNNGK